MPDLQLSDLSPYYNLRYPSIYKKGKFEFTRMWTEYKSSEKNTGVKWRPWDKVAPYLYLGKIPSLGNSYYSAEDQYKKIINFVNTNEDNEHPLGLIVSAVDYFELSGNSVVSPVNWAKENIKHFMLPITDFSADISDECIIATVKAMRECIEQGKSVYVHCKAGRSRSAMLCAIYIAVYGENQNNEPCVDIAKIENDIIHDRTQVEMLDEQRVKAVTVINKMKKMRLEQEEQKKDEAPAEDLATSLKRHLSSLQIKNMINQFTSFKMLAIFACRNQNIMHTSRISSDVQAFFKSILDASDETWYLYLINAAGPLQKLTDEPVQSYISFSVSLWKADNSQDYKKECEELRAVFISELNNHLALVFKCTVDEIKSAAAKLADISPVVKNIVAAEAGVTPTVAPKLGEPVLDESFTMINKV